MKQYIFLALLAVICTLQGLSAQNQVVLSVPDVVAAGGNDVICVPVVADSFPNIAAVQFSLGWDSSQVTFEEVRFGDNPLGLSNNSTAMPVPDNFGVTFTTNDLSGITLDPGTVMFEICFNASRMSGSTILNWGGFLPPEFAQEGQLVAFPFDTIPGSIRYGSDVATTVLPGDTNQDGQVDHADLLNIGLIHGTNGPARPNASPSFTGQFTALWPSSFAGNVNYAHADADGNGMVETADLSLVNNNYANVAAGETFTPAADVSSDIPEAPALTIAVNDINAGETGTMIVSLGADNDPLAVGYALAFTITYDPAQIDAGSFNVNFANAFLGDDLLTIDRVNALIPGRLEIALSRKDQVNTTNPGGQVCRINFSALNNNANGDYTLDLAVVPNAFLLADQSPALIAGSNASLTVMGTTSANEPAWAADLSIYPNPYTGGPLFIRGNLPAIERVTVFDATGRELQINEGNVRELNLDQLPTGTYVLQIQARGQLINRKVVKQ